MFWLHFYHWVALVCVIIAFSSIPIVLWRNEPGYMLLFIFGMGGALLSMVHADSFRPIPYCIATQGSTIQWMGHTDGKAADWWVFINTPDSNAFCEVHSRELYNMGIGYKLNNNYTGVLVGRP